MNKKTSNPKQYYREYMRQYYQRHKESIQARNRQAYQEATEEKKKSIRSNNNRRNTKQYYIHLLCYKYLKQTDPDIVERIREKATELATEAIEKKILTI